MATVQIPNFADMRKSMKDHIETTSFDDPAPPDTPDPDPFPADEPTGKKIKETKVQL